MPDYGIEIPGGFFDEERHLYRNAKGTIVPSTTQVFSVLCMNGLEDVPKDLLEWKRDYGIAVHSAVEYLLQGDLDWDSVDEVIIPPVTGIEQYLKNIAYEPIATEQKMIHSLFGMQFGLTFDGKGTMIYQGKRRHVIIDLKTAVRESPTWRWQLGAYGLAQEKVDGGWLGMNLQVGKDGNVRPYFHDLYAAGREFQTLLAACILKLNSGLAKLG